MQQYMKTPTICFAILLLAAAGCRPAEEKRKVVHDSVNISVRSVKILEYKIPVRATGLLGTTTQMKLSFKTGGIIKKINVKEGEEVRKGMILAILDLSEIQAQVNQAGIGFEKARRDLTRAKNLYNDSVATLEQYQNARSAYELAKAQKQIADFNLLHSQIKAPSDGKIQKIIVETNEMIGPGYPAILFASTENDWVVRTSLTDKDIVKLSMGDSGLVTMDAFPGTKFRGEISELGSVADPVTGTYEAELMILQSLPQFRSGFISHVDIYPAQVKRSLVVPVEALLDARDKSAYVFVYENGKVNKRMVTIGSILDHMVVVKDGLEEAELVVTDGVKYLRPDSQVNLVDQPDNQPQ